MDDISRQLEILFQQTQHTETKVKESGEELEGFRLQLQEKQKLISFMKISAQGANATPLNIERVRRDIAFLDNKLKERSAEIIHNRHCLLSNQRELFNQVSVIQNTVLYKHLAQWKYDQQHSNADVKVLNQIQEWVEVLTDIIWRLRNQLKGLHHTFTSQPNIDWIPTSPSDLEELDRFGCCVDKALETITLSTLVVEKQPPQVMKTNTRFLSTVRYLSGVKLGVEMIRPTVKVTILSENNARAIIQRHQELIHSCQSYPICSSTTTDGHQQQQPAQQQAQPQYAPVQMDFSTTTMNQTDNHDLYAQHQQVVHLSSTTQAASPALEPQQPTSRIHHVQQQPQQQQAYLHHQQLPMQQVQLQPPQYQIPQQQYMQHQHQQQLIFEQESKVSAQMGSYHPLKIVNMNEFEPSGEILNNSNRLECQDRQLVCHFRNMQLKKIKRTEKRGTESVMDEKFVLLFHTQIRIAESYVDEIGTPTQSSWIRQGDLSYHIMAFSLPVVVIVHGNQEPHAWATVTWHNAFARPDDLLYQVPNEVTWRELGQVLSDKFVACAGKGLSVHNLQYLASKVRRSRYENDDVLVSWSQFAKDPLPDKNFTFWEWFHSILKLTRERLVDLWKADRIYGFLDKKGSVDLLLGVYQEPSPIGTFLLRYSETELGGITIAFVSPPCQQPHSSLLSQSSQSGDGDQLKRLSPTSLSSTSNVLNHLHPFNSSDLKTRSIADRIRDLGDLVYLYPCIPKDEAFKKYYSPLNDSFAADNGYIKPMLIQTLVTNYRKNSSSNSMEFTNNSITPTLFSHDNSPEGIYQDNSFHHTSSFATMYD